MLYYQRAGNVFKYLIPIFDAGCCKKLCLIFVADVKELLFQLSPFLGVQRRY